VTIELEYLQKEKVRIQIGKCKLTKRQNSII